VASSVISVEMSGWEVQDYWCFRWFEATQTTEPCLQKYFLCF